MHAVYGWERVSVIPLCLGALPRLVARLQPASHHIGDQREYEEDQPICPLAIVGSILTLAAA
jgi:hypothetical protein